jgi:membrane-bound lytic murein transglycosylase B
MHKFLLLILVPFFLYSHSYSTCEECVKFTNHMHNKYGFSKNYIKNLLESTTHMQSVLNRYNGTTKSATDYSWSRYKRKILIPQSVQLGKNFMKKYAKYLNIAEKTYGVEKEAITAFIRVESKFGLYGGEYSVWDVLTTLAFNPNRKKRFFKSELEKALILARREHINPLDLRGSFAGAMGCVQQMPSIYLKYGVDLDNDGKRNPNSIADCIGSIAKFLKNNHWHNNQDTIIKPKVVGKNYKKLRSKVLSKYSVNTLKNYGITPPYSSGRYYYIKLYNGKNHDIYLGDSNYRVITRYNHSKQYALSIGLYYKALKAK